MQKYNGGNIRNKSTTNQVSDLLDTAAGYKTGEYHKNMKYYKSLESVSVYCWLTEVLYFVPFLAPLISLFPTIESKI